MIIILCLYVVALWAVLSKFKLVRWGLVVRDRLAAHRRIYPRDISRAF